MGGVRLIANANATKLNIMKTSYYLVVMAFAAIGASLMSCQKDEMVKPVAHVTHEEQYSQNCPGGGGEDEDPIILGVLKDDQGNGISDGTVRVLEVPSGSELYRNSTAADGSFCFHLLADTYDFAFEATGFTNDTLHSVLVKNDTSIVMMLE